MFIAFFSSLWSFVCDQFRSYRNQPQPLQTTCMVLLIPLNLYWNEVIWTARWKHNTKYTICSILLDLCETSLVRQQHSWPLEEQHSFWMNFNNMSTENSTNGYLFGQALRWHICSNEQTHENEFNQVSNLSQCIEWRGANALYRTANILFEVLLNSNVKPHVFHGSLKYDI